VALLVFPIALGAAWANPNTTQTGDYPVRVMSYNIHMGFDAEGWLDLEAIAQTIESSGASIVALQEVPRGWYINASVDALNWLARRLNMTYVFGEAADPVWGNAILSRYPIIQSGNTPLPEGGVRPRRSVLWADIDLTDPDDMIVIATHLHHADARPRLLQIPVVLDEYAVRPQRRLIIMGDMNATPDSTEVALFRQAGLRDAFDLAGSGDGFTYRADRPFERIDYIWLSPNLRAADFSVINSTASDHLGIAVTISP
jgi:endonuclease/exonuclease/phosphatase family metal-dependent hydrolase